MELPPENELFRFLYGIHIKFCFFSSDYRSLFNVAYNILQFHDGHLAHDIADFFLCVGLGIGKTDTPEAKLRKSISNERTFSATSDEGFLYQKLGK